MSDFNDDVLQNVVEGVQANGLQGVGGVDVVKLDWGGEDGEVDGCTSKQRWYGGGDACGGVTHSAAFAQLERGVLFDVVLASDCCYEPDHPRLLCRYCTRFSPVRNTTTFQHARSPSPPPHLQRFKNPFALRWHTGVWSLPYCALTMLLCIFGLHDCILLHRRCQVNAFVCRYLPWQCASRSSTTSFWRV